MHTVKLRRESYRGSKPELQRKAAENNRLASRIESYLRTRLLEAQGCIQMLTFDEIARELSEDIEAVRRAMRGAGGHNGITFGRPSSGMQSP